VSIAGCKISAANLLGTESERPPRGGLSEIRLGVLIRRSAEARTRVEAEAGTITMSEPKSTSSHISKLDIIEHHLVASIQMIALGVNPISTHVIVMACEEMVLGIADTQGVVLDFDYRIYVKNEFHEKYRDQVRRPYNYFKHADKDPDHNYDGPDENDLSDVNEILTVMNASGYKKLGGDDDD
jgi:hypothetical protein